MLNTAVILGVVAGLLTLLVLTLYLAYKEAPGRNKRGNWRLRMVGVAAGIAMMGTGWFLINSMVGIFLSGPGFVIAYCSLMLTSPKEPQESHAQIESEESS